MGTNQTQVSYAEVKATTLAVMAKDIALGRQQDLSTWNQVTFWVDKACIPQDHEELKVGRFWRNIGTQLQSRLFCWKIDVTVT